MKTEMEIIESVEERNSLVGHFEVLERVKELFLLPGTGCMTTEQVAGFYEVGIEAIKSIKKDHKEELAADGVAIWSLGEVLKVLEGPKVNVKGKAIVTAKMDGNLYTVPNRGLLLYPKRAVVRIGMLLRDSKVAKEVRTQLLNIEEATTSNAKAQMIEKEQALLLDIGKAYASGSIDNFVKATDAYKTFISRHAQNIQKNGKPVSDVKLGWQKRNQLNAAMRQLSKAVRIPVGVIWNELYSNLEVGCDICVKQRGNYPYIQWIKENEWKDVVNRFNMMCDGYNIPSKKIR